MHGYAEMVALHEAEMSAYRAYVKARTANEKDEDELRRAWLVANREAIKGGVTSEWRRTFLQERASAKKAATRAR